MTPGDSWPIGKAACNGMHCEDRHMCARYAAYFHVGGRTGQAMVHHTTGLPCSLLEQSPAEQAELHAAREQIERLSDALSDALSDGSRSVR